MIKLILLILGLYTVIGIILSLFVEIREFFTGNYYNWKDKQSRKEFFGDLIIFVPVMALMWPLIIKLWFQKDEE